MENQPDAYRILIVDDDSVLLGFMEEDLKREGFQTCTAKTGRQAAEQLEQESVDLLVLDFMLPDMTGRELIENSLRDGRRVPFVVVSGQNDRKSIVQMMKLGALDYVAKDPNLRVMLPSIVKQAVREAEQTRWLGATTPELLEREERHEGAMIESALDACVAIDRSGVICDWNPPAEELFGWSRPDILGQHIAVILPELHFDPVRGEPRLTRETGAIRIVGRRTEVNAKVSDGRRFFAELILFPIRGGNSFGMFVRDITERLRKKQELERAKEAAESANQSKNHFLANMSHEIRTPMNGVLGMAGVLLSTDLTTEQRELAETMQISAEALLAVISDILDFSNIETGRVTFENLDFDLHDAVEGTVKLMAAKAHQKEIEIISFISPSIPSPLQGDPARLRQVLVNLLSNAIKFTERGEISVRVTTWDEGDNDILVRFAVRDTGIGMSRAVTDTLFRPFTQADSSTTRRYGGTGLGLSISKQLAENMGGEIGVQSAMGKGSKFWFTVRLGNRGGSPALVSGQQVLAGCRVLAVTRSEARAEPIHEYLAAWKASCDVEYSTKEAFTRLRRAASKGRPYEIIMLDHNNSGANLVHFARQVKSETTLAAARIVVLSRFGEHLDEGMMGPSVVDACITKPISYSELCRCLVDLSTSRAKTAKPGARQLQSGPENTPTSGRILVAEDNRVNQKVALKMLEKLGYRAEAVANGLEAIEALKQSSFDLVLMDCQMPELDGYDTAREIRRLEKHRKRLTIVALTASILPADRRKCIDAGMDDFLAKPVRMEVLAATLRRWLPVEKPLPAVTVKLRDRV